MKKLLVIVGPTASGKSALAIRLAQTLNGEIVSADSRQIYTHMDIISGKVSAQETLGIPHHMISIKNPWEKYSVAQFQRDAYTCIDTILSSGKTPILVGGTGLYVSAITQGYSFSSEAHDTSLRQSLETLSVQDLQKRLLAILPELHLSRSEMFNRHRLIRRIEKASQNYVQEPNYPRYQSIVFGIRIDMSQLRTRIHERVLSRLEHGGIEETKNLEILLKNHLPIEEVEKTMRQIGLSYYLVFQYLSNTLHYTKLVEKLTQEEYQYARRQYIWWKKDPSIIWISSSFEDEKILSLWQEV